ncbi:MAG: WbqC family protein [Saprospirales bacterium]|nr:WbqC family protein [Saprospirales bacterium]MBK8922866.1 WbqC family protein [Saprospirales bacterium]
MQIAKPHVVLELHYLPPVSWMALAAHAGAVRLEACEHYQKGSFRNRCLIAGPNGTQRLSIPLRKGKHQQTPVRAVRLAYDEPWQQVHWRSIQAAYGNAPYFDHFAGELEQFYQNRLEFLFDFNLGLLQFLLKNLGLSPEIACTESYSDKNSEDFPAGRLDFKNTISPKRTPPPRWFYPAPYPQVFTERHGFLPDLSSLDLLFCCGKQSTQVLQNSLFMQYF